MPSQYCGMGAEVGSPEHVVQAICSIVRPGAILLYYISKGKVREGADTPWNGYREGKAGTCSTMNMLLSVAEGGSAVLHLGGEKCGMPSQYCGMGAEVGSPEDVV